MVNNKSLEEPQQEEQLFLWDYLEESGKPIIMYGTGDGADKILAVLERYGLKPECFTASGDFPMKDSFRDYPVMTFEQVRKRFGDFILLICFGSDKPDVLERIYALVNESEETEEFEVFAPDVPVVGDLTVYDAEYVELNRDKLQKVRKILADEKSREAFDGWLEYRLSGSLDILEQIAAPREEIFELLKLNNEEFFIDAGAFKGDTVEEFLRAVGQYESPSSARFKKIIAIEPDDRNYILLRRKFYPYGKGLFVPVNAVAWDDDVPVGFTATTGRGGRALPDAESGKSGGRQVSVNGVRIDSLCKEKDDKPTLIKIDAEGSELRVLNGAKSVITRCRPKMVVSLYHRAEDMFKLPLLIHSFNPRYKFYLRKSRCIPGWEFQLIVL